MCVCVHLHIHISVDKLLKFRMITGYQIHIKINFISFLHTNSKQNEVLEDFIFNHIIKSQIHGNKSNERYA